MKDYALIAYIITKSIAAITEETPDFLIHLPETDDITQWAVIHRFGAPGQVKEKILDLYPEPRVAGVAKEFWTDVCKLARKNMEDLAKAGKAELNDAVALGLFTDEIVLRQVTNWEATYTPADAIEIQSLAQGIFLSAVAIA